MLPALTAAQGPTRGFRALRVCELPDNSMIAARVGLIRGLLCASPAYLKGRDLPQTPADLASHDCVAYDGFAIKNS